MITKADSLGEYIQILKKNPQEWNRLLDNLNINVSEFFRDVEVFRHFREICIPELVKQQEDKLIRTIACWSCGCSCGEEPYSLAITFREALKEKISQYPVKIWATDISEAALKKAEKAEYTKEALGKVDENILKKYFLRLPNDGYTLNNEIKNMVLFKKHNFFTDPPPKFTDVIFLRNVRIYYAPEQAEKVLLHLSESLKKGGYLVLGKAESMPVNLLRKVFEPVNLVDKIFMKI